MIKCKLRLDIRKNSMIRNDVWCSIIIEYKYKTILGFERRVLIESVYNNSSIHITNLKDQIEECGGIKPFMLMHIETKVKACTNQTKEDLMIKELMDNVVEIEISKEDLKVLRGKQ